MRTYKQYNRVTGSQTVDIKIKCCSLAKKPARGDTILGEAASKKEIIE